MSGIREVHPDFLKHLKRKEQPLVDLYLELRAFILNIRPKSNEILYHTHALTSVYSVSEKTGDAFCMIPIYTNHLNLGFSKGTLLDDPKNLLQGTGKWIRHIPVVNNANFQREAVKNLIDQAIAIALEDSDSKRLSQGITISKIKGQ